MTVYEIVKVHTGDQNGRPPYRLKIVGQYSFCGEILSIATIPLNKVDPESTLSNRDVIIMSFVGNYVSFLVYDNEEGDLCSIQCFDYNKECAIALNQAGSEIELGDTSYVRNQGLIRVDPGFRCIGVLLNHYCFIIIPITAKGIGEFFKLYKSTLSIQGEVNDYCFLQNSVIPTIALISENTPTWSGTCSYDGSNNTLYLITVTPSIAEYKVIYSYFGLPYDSQCIYSIPSKNQAFMILSTHILFYFISQQVYLIVLNSYGGQYVQERAQMFPNSVFNKMYLQQVTDFYTIMDSGLFAPSSSEDHCYLVNARGEILKVHIESHNQLVESIHLSQQLMFNMDVSSVVCLSYDKDDLLFLGSILSQSGLVDLQSNALADCTQTQNCINNIQMLSPTKGSEDTFALLTHGHAPLTSNPTDCGNALLQARLKLPVVSESSFPLQTSSLHKYLKSLFLKDSQLLVLSNSRETDVYSIKDNMFTPLTKDSTCLMLDMRTVAIDVVMMDDMELIVQVCEKVIFVINDNKPLFEVSEQELERATIKFASFAKNYLFFYDSNHSLKQLSFIPTEPYYNLQSLLQTPANPISSMCIFESQPFTYVEGKKPSLFPVEECMEEEIAYSSVTDEVPVKQIDSFVLGENEPLFPAEQQPSKLPVESRKEVNKEEYLLIAFEDGNVQCYTLQCQLLFTLPQVFIGPAVLKPSQNDEGLGGSGNNACIQLHYTMMGQINEPEMMVGVISMGFEDGHFLFYLQQSPGSPCFSRSSITCHIETPFLQNAVHVIDKSYMFSGLILTGSIPCLITAVRGQPQILHLSGFGDCDKPPMMAVAPYSQTYCISTVNTNKGEELRIIRIPYICPSSDISSSLHCITMCGIPCVGNVLHEASVYMSKDVRYDIIVTESGEGLMTDPSPIYTPSTYYQHEQCLAAPVAIRHTISVLCNGHVIGQMKLSPNDRVTCIKVGVRHHDSMTFLMVGLCSMSGYIDDDYCSGSILVFNLGALSPTANTPVELKRYEIIKTETVIMQMDMMMTEGKDFLVVAKATRFLSSSAAAVSLFDLMSFRESKEFNVTNYVSTLTVVKNCILVGDINYGMHFLQYKDNLLSEIGRDNEPSHPLHSCYLFTAKRPTMYFTKYDNMQNIEVFSIEHKRRLLKKIGDFHLPSTVSTVAPIPIPSIEAPNKEDVGNIIATTEGSIAILMPISGEYYTCLKWLQDDIIKNIPQYGALNNRNFRKYQPDGMLKYPRSNKLIDYNVIHRFVQFPVTIRNEIASRTKTNVNDIMKIIEKLEQSILKVF